jgi:hypothetical protein
MKTRYAKSLKVYTTFAGTDPEWFWVARIRRRFTLSQISASGRAKSLGEVLEKTRAFWRDALKMKKHLFLEEDRPDLDQELKWAVGD